MIQKLGTCRKLLGRLEKPLWKKMEIKDVYVCVRAELLQNHRGSPGAHYSWLCVKGCLMQNQLSGSADRDDYLEMLTCKNSNSQ